MAAEIKNICLIAPLQFELKFLIEAVKLLSGEQLENSIFLLNNKKLQFSNSGQGKVNAAIELSRQHFNHTPDLIVAFGSCGGIASDVGIGQIYTVSSVVEYDFLSEFKNVKAPKYSLEDFNKSLPVDFQPVHVASGDKDVLALQERLQLAQNTHAQIVTWETAGFVKAAIKLKQPFIEYRVVVDDTETPFDKGRVSEYLSRAARSVIEALIKM